MHGYLDFNLTFNKDLTFLTGINGCGKTSILRAISALISPSFITLAYLAHTKIAVTVEHERQKISITSGRHGDEISMQVTGARKPAVFKIYNPRIEDGAYYDADEEMDHYLQAEQHTDNREVIDKLRELPTPMFLGLERRATNERVVGANAPRRPRRPIARRKNIFGATLQESLYDSARMAEEHYAAIEHEKDKIKEELRNNLILMAFDFLQVPSLRKLHNFLTAPKERVSLTRGRQSTTP